MSCDQLLLVQRLAVDQNETLASDDWQEHFVACEECRAEWDAFSRSLAIFRQLELERVSQFAASPSWEDFSEILAADWWRWRILRKLRFPVAVAVVATLTVGGVAIWVKGGGDKSSPGATAEQTAEIAPERPGGSASALPRIPSIVPPRQLNFVSSRPARQSGISKWKDHQTQTYVFELRGSSGGREIVEITAGDTAVPAGAASERRLLGPVPGRQSAWRPPNATSLPGRPTRVEYPIHRGQAQ